MNTYKIASAATLVVLLSAGVAFAQVTSTPGGNGVTVTSAPSTSVSSGNGVTVGTFTVMGDAQGASVTSIPLTLTPSAGASASSLTNCQVFNASGAAVGSAFSPVSGANTFVFAPALSAGGSAGTQTYSIRCNVAAGIPAGATFAFNAGTPVLGNSLATSLIAPPTIQQGGTSNILALITLDATHSGGSVTIPSIPVTVTANGAAVSQLTGCALRSISNLSGSLPATMNTNGSVTTFTLATPITVPAGSFVALALTCDISPSAPIGGSFTVSMAPASLGATVNGTAVTPTTVVGATGTQLPTSGTVSISSTSQTGGTGTGGTPGLPNTGAGGNAFGAMLLLALSAAAAFGASLYLKRQLS